MSPSESNCYVYSYGKPASQKRICLNAIFDSYIIVVPADLLTIFSALHGIFKNSVFFYRYKRAKGIDPRKNNKFANGLLRINGKE
jgi:hypothetical protein